MGKRLLNYVSTKFNTPYIEKEYFKFLSNNSVKILECFKGGKATDKVLCPSVCTPRVKRTHIFGHCLRSKDDQTVYCAVGVRGIYS